MSRARRVTRFAAIAILAAGCSSAAAQAPAGGVPVIVRNFRIDAPPTVKAGDVTFDITGTGPTMHEFNIAATDLPGDQLPVAPDGTVDDTTPHAGFTHLAEREGIDIGEHKTLRVHLTPGRYVLYCNMYGHYRAGMWTTLTVTP
jgi:uncharacterized cupredoxin-like copper-binding protein